MWCFFFSSRRRHTRFDCDWSSDVCSSDLFPDVSRGSVDESFNPKLDFAIERFIDAPTRLVWEALTKPEHLKEWYMPKAWGRVSRTEMDVRPGGIFSIDIATGEGREVDRKSVV